MKIAKIGVIGCGNRGSSYADYIVKHPEEAQLVCACDVLEERLTWYGEKYQIPLEMCFEDAQTMLETVEGLDMVIVSVLDIDHFQMAKMVMERGIHCMLEKPISPDPWECMELMNLAQANNCQLIICHVLRYAPLFSTLKAVLEEGSIGEIQAINHAEFVGFEHFNHSYVRGNFRNLSPFVLAKACHDLDILNWLTGKKCLKVSSFGELKYFTKENAPEGAAERCLECSVEQDCAFSAKKKYLTEYTGWPVSMISVDMSLEAREKALAEGKYGRCVFHCDNKVVDRQVVNMLYEDGVTVSFTLNGFNSVGFRETRIFGTKGDILANFGEEFVRVRLFGEPGEKIIHPEAFEGSHGGGDYCMMRDVVRCIREDNWEGVRTGADQSIASHIMAFAAEKSREEGVIVDIDAFKKEIIAKHININTPVYTEQVDKLQVEVFADRKQMGEAAALAVADCMRRLLTEKETIRMVFGAAPSQNEFLDTLTRIDDLPWDRVEVFHMDEYIGLEPEADQRFSLFLRRKLFDIVKPGKVNLLDPKKENPLEECERYTKLFAAEPIDIICLGIGENGHIAFNDPPVADFSDKEIVKVVELDQLCRQQQVNDKCFESLDMVPSHALTLTVPAMMSGQYLFTVVPGSNKKNAVYHTLRDEISTKCPASILRIHENCVLFVDVDSLPVDAR